MAIFHFEEGQKHRRPNRWNGAATVPFIHGLPVDRAETVASDEFVEGYMARPMVAHESETVKHGTFVSPMLYQVNRCWRLFRRAQSVN